MFTVSHSLVDDVGNHDVADEDDHDSDGELCVRLGVRVLAAAGERADGGVEALGGGLARDTPVRPCLAEPGSSRGGLEEPGSEARRPSTFPTFGACVHPPQDVVYRLDGVKTFFIHSIVSNVCHKLAYQKMSYILDSPIRSVKNICGSLPP